MIWTRHEGRHGSQAAAYDAAGARVLVVENGYLNKSPFRRQDYAIAVDDHNGAGRWFTGGPERWRKLGVEVAPWRQVGEHVIVREQRGIGSKLMASPPAWHETTLKRLAGITDRRLVLRTHPGLKDPERPLLEDLAGAHAVVTWGSSLGCRATVLGVPVFYEAPHHVLEGVLNRGLENIEAPLKRDRLPALERMAWAMWSVDEIAGGEPFDYLLGIEACN